MPYKTTFFIPVSIERTGRAGHILTDFKIQEMIVLTGHIFDVGLESILVFHSSLI